MAGGIDSAGGTGLRTAADGIAWPAILSDAGAHLLAINFQLERSQWWRQEEMQRHQLAQLRELVAHAAATVPFYRGTDFRNWLRGNDEAMWAAYRDLPIVTRRIVQEAGAALYASGVPERHGRVTEDETSGSTGVPLRYRTTALAGFFWNAFAMREHFWHKRDFAARHAFIRSRPQSALAPTWGAPSNLIFACGESANLPIGRPLSEKQDWLKRIAPQYLMTTPSTLCTLAEIAVRGELPLPGLREARTVGETVTSTLRDLVRQAWGVGIIDIYSSSECGLLALQCPASGHFHVQSEWAITEILNARGRPCEPGEVGRIVVTPLHNFAMPLVRYDTGDYAEVGEFCPCGRGLTTLTRILGRRRNRLLLPDGTASWPNLSSLPWTEQVPKLRRFQLLQRKNHSLQLRYEADRPLSTAEHETIAAMLLKHLNASLPLDFEHVASLPLSEAGKLEDFITEIDETPGANL